MNEKQVDKALGVFEQLKDNLKPNWPLPVALAILGTLVGITQIIVQLLINSHQLALQDQLNIYEQALQARQLERNRQLKYLEIVYQDIISTDREKGQVALSLLIGLEAELSTVEIVRGLINESDVPEEIKNKAQKSGYRIYLHYTRDEGKEGKKKLKDLSNSLEQRGYVVVSEYLMKEDSQLQSIRYYYDEDEQEANSLKEAVLEFLTTDNSYAEVSITVKNFRTNVPNPDRVKRGTIELWIHF